MFALRIRHNRTLSGPGRVLSIFAMQSEFLLCTCTCSCRGNVFVSTHIHMICVHVSLVHSWLTICKCHYCQVEIIRNCHVHCIASHYCVHVHMRAKVVGVNLSVIGSVSMNFISHQWSDYINILHHLNLPVEIAHTHTRAHTKVLNFHFIQHSRSFVCFYVYLRETFLLNHIHTYTQRTPQGSNGKNTTPTETLLPSCRCHFPLTVLKTRRQTNSLKMR